MVAILFCKIGQNYYQTGFATHIFLCKFDEASWNISRFRASKWFSHNWLWRPYCFSKWVFLHRLISIAINIPCKFGEDIFKNEWDITVYVKIWWTDRHTDGRSFIIFQPWPSPLMGDNGDFTQVHFGVLLIWLMLLEVS